MRNDRTMAMKSFLLTVLACGLLLSPASAQDKTPAEWADVPTDGAIKKRYTSIVASGHKTRIGFFGSLHADCTPKGDIPFRVIKQPEHGTVEIAPAVGFSNYGKEYSAYECNRQKVRGVGVNYRSAKKYIGADELNILFFFPDGMAWEVHYDVNVR
jgi:hypothetical protein